MPIQVIESRKLPSEENVWLKSLRGGLTHTERDRINTEMALQDKDARIKAYLQVIARANPDILQEAFMRNRATFEQLLEKTGLTTEWEARGEAKGKAEGKAEGAFAVAQNMVNMGLPFETVVSATRLEPEKIKALYRQ
jgi:predicted transposase YdaD